MTKAWSRTVWMDEHQLPDLDDILEPSGDPLYWENREVAELNIPPGDPVYEVTITRHDKAGRQVPRWTVVFQAWRKALGQQGRRIPLVHLYQHFASPEAEPAVYSNGSTDAVHPIEADNPFDALFVACEMLGESDVEHPPIYREVRDGEQSGEWTVHVSWIEDREEAVNANP